MEEASPGGARSDRLLDVGVATLTATGSPFAAGPITFTPCGSPTQEAQ